MTPEEQRDWRNHYYGLITHPTLIAKTASSLTTQGWHPYGTPRAKHLYAIDPDDPLATAWNGGLDGVLVGLIARILPLAVSAVPICIGFDAGTARTVLWVAVRPGSTTHAAGSAAVDTLQQCLIAMGIVHADVEVYEGSIGPLRRLIDPSTTWEDTTELRRLSSMPGAQISPTATPNWSGSAGCFIEHGPAAQRELLLLSCQHVFAGDNGAQSLSPAQATANPVNVSHFVDAPFEKLLRKAIGDVEYWKDKNDTARFAFDNGLSDRPPHKPYLDAEAKWTKISTILNEWQDPDDHISGTVFAYPPVIHGFGEFEPSADSPRRWNIDYCLIRPHASSFAGLPINMLWLDADEGRKMHERYEVPRYGSTSGGVAKLGPSNSPDCPMKLSSTFRLEDALRERRVMVKHGATTGITLGVNNGCLARTRQASDGPDRWSSQLVVVGLLLDAKGEDIPFSAKGDSGSIASDHTGAVLGLITSGLVQQDSEWGVDMTYITPIDEILADVRDRYGLVNPSVATPRAF